MTTRAKPVPHGFHSVTPYLIVRNAAEAIRFYRRAFGATERYRLSMPDGRVGHAELQLGNSIVLLADEFPEHGHRSPQSLDGSPVGFSLYVENVDQAFARAVDAGAAVKEAVEDRFWGDRAGTVIDPFGHRWTLLTRIEDLSPDQMKQRMQKMLSETGEESRRAGP